VPFAYSKECKYVYVCVRVCACECMCMHARIVYVCDSSVTFTCAIHIFHHMYSAIHIFQHMHIKIMCQF